MKPDLQKLLGDDASSLLEHHCKTITPDRLHLPGPDFIDRVYAQSDRSARVLRSLAQMFNHGRLARTGYLSILPVDQVSSIPQVRASRPILITLIRRTS